MEIELQYLVVIAAVLFSVDEGRSVLAFTRYILLSATAQDQERIS